MKNKSLQEQVLITLKALQSHGLNQGSAGNVSVRTQEACCVISPQAMSPDICTPEDMVIIDHNGLTQGPRQPSSEWRMHSAIYTHIPNAQAIVHTHSSCCTTLACLTRSIPAFHYMVAVAGGDSIRCAPYATFGTQELSKAALWALDGRSAALLAHHGMICYGDDLDQAVNLAIEVEGLAAVYVQALSIEEPPLLSTAEMQAVLDRFAAYKSCNQ